MTTLTPNPEKRHLLTTLSASLSTITSTIHDIELAIASIETQLSSLSHPSTPEPYDPAHPSLKHKTYPYDPSAPLLPERQDSTASEYDPTNPMGNGRRTVEREVEVEYMRMGKRGQFLSPSAMEQYFGDDERSSPLREGFDSAIGIENGKRGEGELVEDLREEMEMSDTEGERLEEGFNEDFSGTAAEEGQNPTISTNETYTSPPHQLQDEHQDETILNHVPEEWEERDGSTDAQDGDTQDRDINWKTLIGEDNEKRAREREIEGTYEGSDRDSLFGEQEGEVEDEVDYGDGDEEMEGY